MSMQWTSKVCVACDCLLDDGCCPNAYCRMYMAEPQRILQCGQPQDAYVSACTSLSPDYDVRLTTRYNTDDVENEMNVLHHVDARHSSWYSGLTDEQLANYLNWSGFIFESGFEHSSSLAYEMAFSYFMC